MKIHAMRRPNNADEEMRTRDVCVAVRKSHAGDADGPGCSLLAERGQAKRPPQFLGRSREYGNANQIPGRCRRRHLPCVIVLRCAQAGVGGEQRQNDAHAASHAQPATRPTMTLNAHRVTLSPISRYATDA